LVFILSLPISVNERSAKRARLVSTSFMMISKSFPNENCPLVQNELPFRAIELCVISGTQA
jgi:hypothetical protein